MMRSLAVLAAVVLPAFATAQISTDSPIVLALRAGQASEPMPESEGAQVIAKEIQRTTGSQGEVTIEFFRIEKFVAQSSCGRVGYALFQKTSNTYWAQFGGQLNICEDGTPPLRLCKTSGELVPADAQCVDGSSPTDTPEVAAALARASAAGSLTESQFKAKFGSKRKADGGGK